MLISFKLSQSPSIKTEPEDEEQSSEEKFPELKIDNYEQCAVCNVSFLPKDSEVELEPEEGPRRGQLSKAPPEGSIRKIKEFYSFNTVTGELLHVTALQAIIAVFELRLSKSAPGVNLQEANENLGFCTQCCTLVSQLYKLHQEVSGLVQAGSNLFRMIEYEDTLTDSRETDFANPKKRRKFFRPQMRLNGSADMEEMEQDGNDSWNVGADVMDTSWANDDDGGHDDFSFDHDPEVENDEDMNTKARSGGLKITNVESASSFLSDDVGYEDSETDLLRGRRRSRKVDYKKVLEGPHIEGLDDDTTENGNDEDWKLHLPGKRAGPKSVARKKTAALQVTAAAPAVPRKRGRPKGTTNKKTGNSPKRAKNSAVKVPPPKAREATCNLCRKVFPSHYLAEHMNIAHNAIQGQPCLICGRFFENGYRAIKHLLTHVPERPFGCSRCHDTFRTADERNTHTSAHLDSDKPMQCPKCTQSFTSLLLLNKHEAQKHRQTKSFLCSICAKLLSGKDEWIQHILSHGPFQCYYCREYFRPGEYKRHIQTVHINKKPGNSSSGGPPTVIAEVTLDD